MNAAAAVVREALATFVLGTPMEGGFFTGAFQVDGKPYGSVVSPKAEGDLDPRIWIGGSKAVPGALSLNDGRGNTAAMAAAGSALATVIMGLSIGGYSDWYLGAQDELELAYRAFKPTTEANWLYARSGINVSALPPTYPYAKAFPLQTAIDAFRAGGSEAFEPVAYHTSTQHADGSAYAWGQDFDDGYQGHWYTDNKLRARAFRRFAL